jgi:hypothetical protein
MTLSLVKIYNINGITIVMGKAVVTECHFTHHKSHSQCPGIKPRPLQRGGSDQPSDSIDNPHSFLYIIK